MRSNYVIKCTKFQFIEQNKQSPTDFENLSGYLFLAAGVSPRPTSKLPYEKPRFRSLFSYSDALHRRIVVARLSPTPSFNSLLWAVSLRKKQHSVVFSRYPYEGKKEVRTQGCSSCTSVLKEIISIYRIQKNAQLRLGIFYYLFENN